MLGLITRIRTPEIITGGWDNQRHGGFVTSPMSPGELWIIQPNEESFMKLEINGKVGGKLVAPCTYHLSCVTIVIRDCN